MDFPYVILIASLLFLSFMEWRHPKFSNSYFKVACWIVFIFIAFRAPVIGGDTWNYYRYAMGIRNFYNRDQRDLEILYEWYNSFFRNYCRIGVVWMSVNTLIIFSPICYMLWKYVKYKTFGVVSFFLFVYYFDFVAALRQMLSLSIILWGVIYVLENRKWKLPVYVAMCAVAYFMHTTAVVIGSLFLVAYIVPLKSRLVAFGAIVVSAVVGIILEKFSVVDAFTFFLSMDVNLIERVEGYFESDTFNEMSPFRFALRRALLGIVAFAFIDKEKINHWFSKNFLVGIILYNLFWSAYEINRMVVSNQLFTIMVLPWIFEGKAYLRAKTRQYINIIMLFILLYFTQSFVKGQIYSDLTSAERMHPYYFFFQDYHTHPSIRYFK